MFLKYTKIRKIQHLRFQRNLSFPDVLREYQENVISHDSVLRQLSDASTQTQDIVAFQIDHEDKTQPPVSSKQELPSVIVQHHPLLAKTRGPSGASKWQSQVSSLDCKVSRTV
jgi:hypothetical protein